MPNKKSKKPSRNGFWEFVLECRERNAGNKHQTMDELQTNCSRRWAAMSKEDRQPYEYRAQLARDNHRPQRLTNDGEEIEEVERQAKEAQAKIQEMKNNIMKNVKAASFAMNLDEQVFLLIHINHLIHVPAQDKFYICEVGISAFNLRNGVLDVFHELVYPGPLPLGFSGGAMSHSKETHQLYDLVIMGDKRDNTSQVFKSMIQFIEKYTSHGPPIVYSDEKTFEMITKVIDRFEYDFNYAKQIKVYNLQYLFFALRNTVEGKIVWSTETFSFSALDKDLYGYTPGISCKFHEESDMSVCCSKSIVTRYVYTICDHCCEALSIQLLPGCHVPTKSKVASAGSRSTSHAPSVCSNDEIRSRTQSRSDTSSSFASAAAYDNNYPPLSSARSAASSVRSFASLKAGASGSAASRVEKSFKALSVKEVDKRNREQFPNLPDVGNRS